MLLKSIKHLVRLIIIGMSMFLKNTLVNSSAFLKQKSILLLLLFTLSPLTAATPTAVSIPLLDWSSQRVISKAIGNFLTTENYQVQYKTMSENDLLGSMARGLVHFHIEVWQASAGREFQLMVNKKRFIDLGKHSARTMEEWWYPLYVEKLCPGLPDWKALLNCSQLFSDRNSTKGVYHLGPWEYNDADLIRSLGLNFKIKKHQNNDLIWQELEKSIANQRPMILLNWTPNWTDQRIPGRFVKFPEYHPLCETNPSWGINPDLKYDCGNVQNAWIKKAAWKGLQEQFPCVYGLIKNMDLTNEMIAEASALIDYDKVEEETAALLWLDKNLAKVQSWGDDGCFSNGSS